MGDDGLDVHGGAGGMAADYTDLRSQATAMRDAGGDLLDRVGRVSSVAVDGDLLAAALVCPDLVPGVEAAVLMAATGPDGLSVRGGLLLTGGTLIDASVTTYEFVDEASARALDALQAAGGFAAGSLLPGVVVLGGLGITAVVATNPALAALLVSYAGSGRLPADLQRTLYDNPWLMEALTRGAPTLVQGSGFSLSLLLGPGGPGILSALTGGRWPTLDYEDAVAGLIGLGQLGGAFGDTGTFTVADDPSSVVDVRWSQDTALEDVFTQQTLMDDGQTDAESGATGQLRVIAVPQPDGSTAYVVQIPGTEDWSPTRTGNPVDLTSNVTLMTGQDSVWRQTVIDAIRQHVPDGAPVMLTGHSQGGITAASIASDPAIVRELDIRSVVTGGSPIGRFDIDPSVSVLSLEHEQDPVPMLDGTNNPDEPNWTTVRRDLPDELATRDGVTSPGTAHGSSLYAGTGAMVDDSHDPTIDAWREQNAMFFAGDGQASAARYDVSPG